MQQLILRTYRISSIVTLLGAKQAEVLDIRIVTQLQCLFVSLLEYSYVKNHGCNVESSIVFAYYNRSFTVNRRTRQYDFLLWCFVFHDCRNSLTHSLSFSLSLALAWCMWVCTSVNVCVYFYMHKSWFIYKPNWALKVNGQSILKRLQRVFVMGERNSFTIFLRWIEIYIRNRYKKEMNEAKIQVKSA